MSCVSPPLLSTYYIYRLVRLEFFITKQLISQYFQTIQYKARGKVLQSETRELASLSRGKIRPGESDEWSNEQLYVPPLPPTNLRGCHLIQIQYDVYVSVIRAIELFSVLFVTSDLF